MSSVEICVSIDCGKGSLFETATAAGQSIWIGVWATRAKPTSFATLRRKTTCRVAAESAMTSLSAA